MDINIFKYHIRVSNVVIVFMAFHSSQEQIVSSYFLYSSLEVFQGQ